jgi:serine/threonine protein kinase
MLAALGHYKLLDGIGSGRMGELFRARDMRVGRTVAVRIVADHIAGHPEDRRHFVDDVRATAVLSHPNIAALYEIGDDQGHLFLVTEYVAGDTLRTVLAGGALTPRHAVGYGIQLADALADAHAHGILHQDIRPATIIIAPTAVATFTDVGLARWTAGGEARRRVPAALSGQDGSPSETVRYMSPEQIRGEPPDHRADIFSLGAVLFEMLSGRPPFEAASFKALAAQILVAEPPSLRLINPTVPAELEALVVKMLAKDLDQRYETVVAVASELRAVAAIVDLLEAAGEATPSIARSRWFDNRTLIIALLLVIGLAGAVMFLW